jgi:hypothetical protein
MIDAYTWSVAYIDDTVLHEFDEDRPDGRGWSEVGFDERSDVSNKPVKIIMLATPEVDRVHRVVVPQDAKPVFFRRRYVMINTSGQENSDTSGCLAHCIGWKRGEEAVYLFVFSDGSSLLSSDLQAV